MKIRILGPVTICLLVYSYSVSKTTAYTRALFSGLEVLLCTLQFLHKIWEHLSSILFSSVFVMVLVRNFLVSTTCISNVAKSWGYRLKSGLCNKVIFSNPLSGVALVFQRFLSDPFSHIQDGAVKSKSKNVFWKFGFTLY